MRIIGAGFGRTGTLSTKAALEALGFGPCYHMLTAFENPDHLRTWDIARRGGKVDWAGIFAGFGATMDWPACDFWEVLAQEYPDAKIILTTRDPESWYESFRETLAPLWHRADSTDPPAPELADYLKLVRHIALDTFGGRLDDRTHVISVFEKHNSRVRSAAPSDRLLVFDVRDGWRPLCEFLGVPVPANAEFPRLNDRTSFRELARRRLAEPDQR
ncbi:MAG TPA: sulfotransferase [Streptosporangiaceae bacterium]